MVRGMNEERLNKEGTVRGKLMREQGRVGMGLDWGGWWPLQGWERRKRAERG